MDNFVFERYEIALEACTSKLKYCTVYIAIFYGNTGVTWLTCQCIGRIIAHEKLVTKWTCNDWLVV